MLFCLIALYTIFFDIKAGKSHLYIYNVFKESEVDTLSFYKEQLQESFFYTADGSGQFTFSTYTGDSVIFYLYSITSKELRKVYTLYMEEKEPYFVYREDKKITPMNEAILVNDTLLLLGGISYFGNYKQGPPNYVIYINPSKEKIIKVISVPEAETGPRFRAYSKKNGFLAFGVYGLGICNLCGKICLLDVNTGSVNKIAEGYLYPKSWLDDSLLLLIDESEYIDRQKHYKPGDTIYYSSDLLTYNIHKDEIKKIMDNTKATLAYKYGAEIYFVEVDEDYKNQTTSIIVKDKRNNEIKKRNIQQIFYRNPNFILFPENIKSNP